MGYRPRGRRSRGDARRLDKNGSDRLDLGYLVGPPRIWAWRTGSEDLITVAWQHETHDEVSWAAPTAGRVQVTPAEFWAAVELFHNDLMAAMAERVTAVVGGALDPQIDVDLDRLQGEQAERLSWLFKRFQDAEPTDWDAIRAGVRSLRRRGPALD